MTNRLAHNIAYNLIGQFALAVLGLLAVKYILSDLGSDAFGVLMLIQVMNATLATVLDRGIASTTTREVANRAHNDPALYQLLRTASLFYWGAFVMLALAVFASAPWVIHRWFNLVTMSELEGIYVLRVLAIASLLELPRSFYGSLFRGLQRMDISNGIDVSGLFVQQAGVLLLLWLDASLIRIVYWMACCFVLSTCAAMWLAVSRFPRGALLPGYYPDAVRSHGTFAGQMTAISLTAFINTGVDKAVLSRFLPIGVVGYYGFAFSLVSSLKALAGATALAAFPSFAGRTAKFQRNALVAQYRKLQNVNAVVNFAVFAAFAAVQYPVFSFLLNEEAARLLLIPTLLLCAGSYMNSIANIPYALSIAVGAPVIALRATLYSFFFLTPLTIYLTATLGVLGASLSWVVFNVFVLVYTVPRVCRECLGIAAADAYAPVLNICLIGSAIGGAGLVIREAAGIRAEMATATLFVGSALIFVATSYCLVFDSDLRETLLLHAGLKKRANGH